MARRRAARRRAVRPRHARAARRVARALPCADVAGAATVSRRHRGLDGLRHRARDRAPAVTAAPTTWASPTRCAPSPGAWPRSTTSVSGCTSSRTCTRRPGPTRRRSTRCTTARSRGSTTPSSISGDRCRTRRPSRPTTSSISSRSAPQLRGRDMGRGGRTPRRSTSSTATSSRSCSRSASISSSRSTSARRLPGAAPRQPVAVHVLPAPPRGDGRRVLAGGVGAAAQRPGHQPPDRGDAPAGPDRGARSQARGGAGRASRRNAPSTSCSSTWRATTSAAWCASAPSRSRS